MRVAHSEIVVAVEAGEWPPETALEHLARQAIAAADEALDEAARQVVPPPFTGEGDHAQHGGGGSHTRDGRHSPPPPPSAVPLPRSAGEEPSGEVSVVFTDDARMQKLNEKWRGKDSPTNVLSFPQTGPPSSGGLLGDVILSAETVAREASLADKRLEDHMAHLIIHGYLHLLGFDHEAEGEAEKMEELERVALRKLGIPDPYATASGE